MNLRRLVAAFFMDAPTMELLRRQTELIADLRLRNERDRLIHARTLRDLIVRFREVMNDPDLDDVKELLDAAIVDLSDEVARAEEHLV